MKKILIIGQGSLGYYIKKQAILEGYDVLGTYHNTKEIDSLFLNVCDINSIEDIIKNENPDYAINCAARGDVDYLETHSEDAFNVNTLGAENVAKILHENKIRLVHISTDSIFDGIKGNYSEEDQPNPVNVYAQSKYEGEKKVSQISSNHLIIRTNFYGLYPNGRYFFNWILDNIKQKKSFLGFTDIIFSPLDVSTVSKMITESLEINYNGVLHFASDCSISKYDFIKNILDYFNLKNPLSKGSIDSQKLIACRPKNTSLNNLKSKDLLTIEIPSFLDWIKENEMMINRYLNN